MTKTLDRGKAKRQYDKKGVLNRRFKRLFGDFFGGGNERSAAGGGRSERISRQRPACRNRRAARSGWRNGAKSHSARRRKLLWRKPKVTIKPSSKQSKAPRRGEDGRTYLPHTLNNTVVAPPRMLIAFLENNLRADGTVASPEVLRPYMGFKDHIG